MQCPDCEKNVEPSSVFSWRERAAHWINQIPDKAKIGVAFGAVIGGVTLFVLAIALPHKMLPQALQFLEKGQIKGMAGVAFRIFTVLAEGVVGAAGGAIVGGGVELGVRKVVKCGCSSSGNPEKTALMEEGYKGF